MSTNRGSTNWRSGGANDTALVRQGGSDATTSAGGHSHTFNISAGGDATTRPDNVILGYIIKAADRAITAR
jgi:hypothetical protein